ncbi:MAG: hypothetical protein IPN34_05015 [Planctomycetes bacterium]|nr:hypothetical protein [Planctomycetota bacterium]
MFTGSAARAICALSLAVGCASALAQAGSDEESARRDAASVKEGLALLLRRQESLAEPKAEPCEWPYEGVYRVRGEEGMEIPLGYRVGGTALIATTLLGIPGYAEDAPRRAAVERALVFVLETLPDARLAAGFRRGYDVRGWGHACALELLVELRRTQLAPEFLRPAIEDATKKLIALLEEGEIETLGGWNYSRRGEQPEPSTFMTATTLQALFAARAQGFAVDEKVVVRALNALASGRFENGAFQYGVDPEHRTGKGFEAPEGSAGRSCACEATLFLAGRSNAEKLRAAIDAFFAHWEWLEKRRKQTDTHVPPFQIAPYYFFYAHHYAAQAIELLPEAERAERRARLRERIYQVRESSGGWNDRVFERSESYGTAMVLRALLAPTAVQSARWAK